MMGKVYSNLVVEKKESVVDEFLLLNPLTTPMLSLIGFSAPVYNTTHEWIEHEMIAQSAVTGGIGDEAGHTNLPIKGDVAETTFRVGQVIQMNAELLKVTAVVDDSNLTVVRGYAGTTRVAHADDTVTKVLYNEAAEGADARAARYQPGEKLSNITQIFDDSIVVTGSTAEIEKYGIDNIYENEKQRKIVELAFNLESALISGVRHTSGQIRTFDGIKSFIDTNVVDASVEDISKNLLNSVVQDVYDVGGLRGGNYTFIASPRQRRKIGELDAASLIIERSDNVRGERVDYIVTDLGTFPVRTNPNLNPDEVLFLDTNRVKIKPLGTRGFFHEFLGRKGDYYHGQIIGEYTLEFKQEKAHARVRNLKTT